MKQGTNCIFNFCAIKNASAIKNKLEICLVFLLLGSIHTTCFIFYIIYVKLFFFKDLYPTGTERLKYMADVFLPIDHNGKGFF